MRASQMPWHLRDVGSVMPEAAPRMAPVDPSRMLARFMLVEPMFLPEFV